MRTPVTRDDPFATFPKPRRVEIGADAQDLFDAEMHNISAREVYSTIMAQVTKMSPVMRSKVL